MVDLTELGDIVLEEESAPLEKRLLKFYDEITPLIKKMRGDTHFHFQFSFNEKEEKEEDKVELKRKERKDVKLTIELPSINKIDLPLLVYTRCEHLTLPLNKIFGWVMGKKRAKNRENFIIFVPQNQDITEITQTENLEPKAKRKQLFDEDYIPLERRYPTLSMACSQLYGKPNAPYAPSNQIEVYKNGGREWFRADTHATMEVLQKNGFQFEGKPLPLNIKLFYPARKKKSVKE